MTILTIINDNPADYDFNETKRRMIEGDIIAIASMGLWIVDNY